MRSGCEPVVALRTLISAHSADNCTRPFHKLLWLRWRTRTGWFLECSGYWVLFFRFIRFGWFTGFSEAARRRDRARLVIDIARLWLVVDDRNGCRRHVRTHARQDDALPSQQPCIGMS